MQGEISKDVSLEGLCVYLCVRPALDGSREGEQNGKSATSDGREASLEELQDSQLLVHPLCAQLKIGLNTGMAAGLQDVHSAGCSMRHISVITKREEWSLS